jgi:hypothetical protein
VLLALFGAGAGAAIMTSVTAATVINVAASKVASPGSAAFSGAAGSTTSGSTGGGALVISGSTAQAFMTGTPWHVAVLVGALLVFIAGLATALRGPDWPVMSARYDAPGARDAGAQADAPGGHGGRAGRAGRAGPGGRAGLGGRAGEARPLDAATMWESLNGGEDPTADESAEAEDDPAETADDPAENAPPPARTAN